jgi:class 3 adenylate cyclase
MALAHNDLASYVEHNNEFVRINDEINGKDTATRLAMQDAERKIESQRKEYEKQLAVLHATLPKDVADRVARGEIVSDAFNHAAVLFADVVGFTTHSTAMTAREVAAILDQLFARFDDICKQHHVLKVKTIGDAYLCFKGDGTAEENASAIGSVALEILKAGITWPSGEPLTLRIGLHSGPVTAGVIGTERLQYDIWGDTVNTASRMESTSEAVRIHVSEAFALLLSPGPSHLRERGASTAIRVSSQFPIPSSLRERGALEIKGKGQMQTYWLDNEVTK